jgi:hypothetical protein
MDLISGKKKFWFLDGKEMWDFECYLSANRIIPEDKSLLKIYLLKYTANWMGWSDMRLKAKNYSQAFIFKRTYKSRIWNDMTWDNSENLLDD